MTYNLYPAVDGEYQFPPVVRQAIADSPELPLKFATKEELANHTHEVDDIGTNDPLPGQYLDGDGTWRNLPTTSTVIAANAGYDIVVFVGQSNATGGNNEARDPLIDVDDPHVFSWPGAGTYVNRIILGRDELDFPSPDASTGVAPALEFGRWWTLANPGRRILVVPAAVGGSSLIAGPWAVGGSHYNKAIEMANGAVAAAGANARVIAIVWQQGENEGWASHTEASYATSMDATLNGLRAAITGAATAKIIVGGMVPFWRTTTPTGGSALNVHAAHVKAPSRLTNTMFVDGPWGLANGFESVHYSAEGARVIGRSMAKALLLDSSPLAVPDQVTGITTAPAYTSMTVGWTAPAAHPRVDRYRVEYSPAGQNSWAAIPLVPGAYLTATISGLTASTSYDFRVTAINQIGSGTSSAIVTRSTNVAVYAGGVAPTMLFDARNLANADGTAVTTWPDAVSSKNAVQSTPAAQPVFQANGLGTGKPAVFFTSGDYLSTNSIGAADIGDVNGYFTVIAVATRSGTADSGVAGIRKNLDPAFFNLNYSNSGSKWSYEAFAGSYAAGYGAAQQAATAIDVPTILVATRGTAASLSVNSLIATVTGAIAPYTGSTKIAPLILGGVGYDAGVTSPLNGKIGYLAIYRGVLSPAQIDAIETDLSAAFGVTLV